MATALAVTAIAATVISTGLTLYSASQQADMEEAQGEAANQAAKERADAANQEAAQLDQQAGQQRAAAQRKAMADRAQENLVLSNATAAAAASGGGATDPSVVNVTGQISARGEYDALSDLYSGEESARGSEYQATVDRTTAQDQLAAGQFDQQAGAFKAGLMPVTAAGTVLKNASGALFSKYGGGDPNEGEIDNGLQRYANYGDEYG